MSVSKNSDNGKWVTCMSFPENLKSKLNKVQYLYELPSNNYNETIVFAIDKLLEMSNKEDTHVSN